MGPMTLGGRREEREEKKRKTEGRKVEMGSVVSGGC